MSIHCLRKGPNPNAIYHDGKYYYTHETNDQIFLWVTTDITDMPRSTCKEVWVPKDPSNSYHLWNPEIRNIDGKWYIYFAADDGNTDNHQIYVIENDSPDPMQGEFRMKGAIMTNPGMELGDTSLPLLSIKGNFIFCGQAGLIAELAVKHNAFI